MDTKLASKEKTLQEGQVDLGEGWHLGTGVL